MTEIWEQEGRSTIAKRSFEKRRLEEDSSGWMAKRMKNVDKRKKECVTAEVVLHGRRLSTKKVIFMEYLDICISAWIKST